MLTLDVAISTYRADGIARVARQNLPQLPGVRYIVSWQASNGAEVPENLKSRPDVEIYRFDGTGLSANRNNALDHCSADIVLIADDDVTYTASSLAAVIAAFEQSPATDIATFMSDRDVERSYPSGETDLSLPLPRGYSVTSFEIALRRSTGGTLRFWEELGLNSPRLHGGEDEVFLLTAIRRGLRCRFFPLTVCSHPAPSTGTKARLTPGNLRASGCVIALTYPATAVLRIPLKAWRVWRSGRASLAGAIVHLTAGALAAPGISRQNRKEGLC